MTKLLEKLKTTGSIKATTLAESTYFNDKDYVVTDIPSINVAFSGKLDGGMVSGLTVVAGPSKHFKSSMGLVMVKAYLNKYSDAICLFYDSEYGITAEYIKNFDIDPERIIHIPIENIEQLKFDLIKKLEAIERGEHVIIFIDSIGNLASKKEVEDALDEKSVADMSRAKALKSLFRIITPHLSTKNLPCIAINHVYQEIGLFPKAIVGGGTGIYYSANQIFIIGRSQEKGSDGEIDGWNFTLNVEKSRFVKEKSKLPILVTYDGGIDRWSGFEEWALEFGFMTKSGQWYQLINPETGEVNEKKFRRKDFTDEMFESLLNNESFKKKIEQKFSLSLKRN